MSGYDEFAYAPHQRQMNFAPEVERGRELAEQPGLMDAFVGGAASFITGTILSGGNPVMGAIAAGGHLLNDATHSNMGTKLAGAVGTAVGSKTPGTDVNVNTQPVDTPVPSVDPYTGMTG